MENKTILPEKWCVKCTPETYYIIHEEFEKLINREGIIDMGRNSYYHFPEYDYSACTCIYIKEYYKEITFDEFKEYIKEKKSSLTYEIY